MKIDCKAIQKQLEAYALGVLETAEQEQVERHIGDCPDCLERLSDYHTTLADLPNLLLAVSPQMPPESLKDALLQQIEAEQPQTAPDVIGKRPFRPKLKDFFTWPRVAIALGGVAALIFAWFFINNLWPPDELPSNNLEAIEQQQTIIREVIEADDTVEVVLAPQQDGSDAWGHLYRNPHQPTAVLIATQLPQPPKGQSYFVWYGTEEEFELAGTMNVNEQGFGLLSFESDPQEEMSFAQIALQPITDLTSGELVLRWAKEP